MGHDCIARRVTYCFLGLVSMLWLGNGSTGATDEGGLSPYAAAAYDHICRRMDQFDDFYIYRDADWGGNADYVPSGWMGDHENFSLDPAHERTPENTCLRIEYDGRRWAGVTWQRPKGNWGKGRERWGRDLTGATALTFFARSLTGRQPVQFGLGGIGGGSGDSARKRARTVVLDRIWKKYEITLDRLDLSHVVGGFFVVLNRRGVVLVDNVRLDIERPADRLRLIPSYVVRRQSPLYPVNRNVAYLYDCSLAMICFSAMAMSEDASPERRKDARRRLRVLADAVVFAQENDRVFHDGRLRNAYWGGGDVRDYRGRVRLPGRWDQAKKRWYEDRYAVSSHTGNLAWAGIALLDARQAVGNPEAGQRYLAAAVRLAEWIEEHTRMDDRLGGYAGGAEGWRKTRDNPDGQQKIPWRSTQHNIDVLVFAGRLAAATGDDRWSSVAEHARAFVMAMFNEQKGHFWTGTLPDGQTNKSVIPLDCQTWALLAMPQKAACRRAVEWAESTLRSRATCGTHTIRGYPFSDAGAGVWPEGTAQMGLAWRALGKEARAAAIRQTLRTVQKESPRGDGKGLVAAVGEPVSTGMNGNRYHPALHIGATAWFCLLEMSHNPFTGVAGPR